MLETVLLPAPSGMAAIASEGFEFRYHLSELQSGAKREEQVDVIRHDGCRECFGIAVMVDEIEDFHGVARMCGIVEHRLTMRSTGRDKISAARR